MRFFFTLLAIALVAAVAEWYGPWWTAALVAGIAGLLSGLRTGEAFLAGFWGIALMWLCFLLTKDLSNHHFLSNNMARLFHLPSYLFYILATFLLGGLTGGLPAWAGAHIRKMFLPNTITPAS